MSEWPEELAKLSSEQLGFFQGRGQVAADGLASLETGKFQRSFSRNLFAR